ncbi:hypothetical protein JG688_00013340 [Phytophthora aleatoria]|uniref:Uncharacterized protein n=1 Tax=Phytophthora aleatoria TaxID=2496075 RepID=A0A8J5IM96_9STRA|nr:hypothetical protein JG688_00013340 [Phytophthora aleatoria]
MEFDETVGIVTLHRHGWDSFNMANKVELAQWIECHCSKCSYYRSPTWRAKQADDMTCSSLAPKRFYRRGHGKIYVAYRIYNKPWKH